MVRLESAPKSTIKYTTDGSDPKISGGVYNEPFAVPKGTVFILAYGEKNKIISDVYKFEINWGPIEIKVDPEKPATMAKKTRPKDNKRILRASSPDEKIFSTYAGPSHNDSREKLDRT